MSVPLLQTLLSITKLSASALTVQSVAYELRFQSTFTGHRTKDNLNYTPVKITSDDEGNVYGVTKLSYFKISKYGNVVFVKEIPGGFNTGQLVVYGLSDIAVSPNGSYVVICGTGGDTGYDSTQNANGTGGTGEYYGSEIIAFDIDRNTGSANKYYKVKDDTVPQAFRMCNAKGITVDDDGICNVVGDLYRIFDAPYNEFCRLVIDLVNQTIVTALGDTNGTYMEGWKDVASNGNKIIMGGLDSQNVQAGYQTHNWSLFDHDTGTADWTKTWQSNSGNGVMGGGVCITDGGVPRIFAGYRDVPLQEYGIIEIDSTTGTPNQYTRIHYTANDYDDITITDLTTDGTNVYFVGWTTAVTIGVQTYLIGCMDIATKTAQWANTLTRTSSETCWISKLKYNPGTGKLTVSGNTTPSNDGTHTAFVLEFPTDGSGAGNYGSYVYSVIGINSSNSTSSSWYSGSPSFSNYTSTTIQDASDFSNSNSSDLATWQLNSDYGHDEFIIPGTYEWTCPPNVTSVCAVAVGAGGSGGNTPSASGGGGGGGLGWKNNIAVTPGQTYTVVVGDRATPASGGDGGDSYFINTSTVCGFGGSGNNGTLTGGAGGSYTGDGGGDGGDGGSVTNAGGYEGGGGGAGGYTGKGGNGGSGDGITNTANANGGMSAAGGGGGGGAYSGAHAGGGVRLRGIGANGRGGIFNPADTSSSAPFVSGSGETGSYDGDDIVGTDNVGTQSGIYGGGGAGSQTNSTGTFISLSGWPGTGGVRIIWGADRQYPDTNTGNDVTPPENVVGEAIFTTMGTNTWTCPANVTSVCAVAVGAGGQGISQAYTGGGGGGLGWKNNIPVTPGQTYTVEVAGATGSTKSFFINELTVAGLNGQPGGQNVGGAGGGFVGDGGGNGGDGGSAYGSGGGGAGGYSGNGGDGGPGQPGSGTYGAGSNGSGGSGGGGAGANHEGGAGGGVGLYGEGSSGLGSTTGQQHSGGLSYYYAHSGQGGSNGSPSTTSVISAGTYGGGDGGGTGVANGKGAVRIIWGANRAFPSTFADNWFYEIGDWVPEQGGYYAGVLTTGTESFTNLEIAGIQYRIFIAEKSVSQSIGQYKNAQSCDGNHASPGTTTAPNSEWNGYFNTYQSVLANASSSTHPIFHTVQNLSITVDGTVFDDWYIPAHREAGVVYDNLKNATDWQTSNQKFDTTSPGTSYNLGELWTSSGDSCGNSGTQSTAGHWFTTNGSVWGYSKDGYATIRPIRRVAVNRVP